MLTLILQAPAPISIPPVISEAVAIGAIAVLVADIGRAAELIAMLEWLIVVAPLECSLGEGSFVESSKGNKAATKRTGVRINLT